MVFDKLDDNYFILHTSMIKYLRLKGCELLTFMIIYNFSRDGAGYFTGSIKYLQDNTLSTRNTVIASLNSLLKKGLIIKETENREGTRFVKYRVNNEKLVCLVDEWCKKFTSSKIDDALSKNDIEMSKIDTKMSKTAPNINIYNNSNNIKEDIDLSKDKYNMEEISETKVKKFVKPTILEIQNYIDLKGYHVDAEEFYNFYESKGWVVGKSPMKNWQSATFTWEKKFRETMPTESEEDKRKRLRLEEQKRIMHDKGEDADAFAKLCNSEETIRAFEEYKRNGGR